MKPEAEKLRRNFVLLEKQFSEAKTALEEMVQSCSHKFCEPIYEPIRRPAYTCPGDPPGTMGVDWRGPCYVSAETVDRWKRVCKLCGLEQYTTQVKEYVNVKKSPAWPNEEG